MARVNSVPNPSFRDGLAHWSPVNGAALSISSDTAFYGSTSMLITKGAADGPGIQTSDFISIQPSLAWAASAYAQVPITIPASETTNVILKILWYDFNQTLIYDTSSSVVTLEPSDEWSRPTAITTAPPNAAYAKLSLAQLGSGTAGQPIYVDAFLLEQSNFVGGYLDNITSAEERSVVNSSLRLAEPPVNYRLPLNADIVLNDLVFNTIDENNVVWICSDIDGWWGQSAPDSPDITRGAEDGSYDVSGRYQARTMNFTGSFLPPSLDGVGPARDILVDATNLVRGGGWLRTNENPTRAAFVRLTAQPSIITTNARGRTDFSIPLKAADPIKYHWNDADPEGFTNVSINGYVTIAYGEGFYGGSPYGGVPYGSSIDAPAGLGGTTGEVNNIGTSPVTAIFSLTGPLGAGSTIYNDNTDELITVIQSLRGTGSVGSVIFRELLNNIATLTTTGDTNLNVGDSIVVAGVGSPFDTADDVAEIVAVSHIAPYTLSYNVTNLDIDKLPASGTVGLAQSDVLVLDTYNRSVTLNGAVAGSRAMVDTLIDWMKLNPGKNLITFYDSIDSLDVINKQSTGTVATLTTSEPHYIHVGDLITVQLPTTANLSNKVLVSNVATLTTLADHGFSVGDVVQVTASSIVNVTNKALTSNVAYITTDTITPVSVADSVRVSLSTDATLISKSIASNVATVTTTAAHGFSAGDAMTVTLPTAANVATKSLTNNIATIATKSAHNFSVGDTITVSLPYTATAIQKAISGSTVVLTTSSAHNFSVGDKVTVALPTSATLTGTRSIDGGASYYVTLTAAAAHGYVVGDQILVDSGLTSLAQVTTRSATATTCTVTTNLPHSLSVGQNILISGVSPRYNGYAVITAVTSTTVSWSSAGITESAIGSIGAIQVVGTVVSRSATSSSATLTTSVPHGFSVGEKIVVTGVAAQYNGTFTITGVTSTTVTYAITGGTIESSTSSSGTVDDITLTSGYNGIHYIETIPTSTTFTYLDYDQKTSISSTTYGTTPTAINLTNLSLNGADLTITGVSSDGVQFSYTKGL